MTWRMAARSPSLRVSAARPRPGTNSRMTATRAAIRAGMAGPPSAEASLTRLYAANWDAEAPATREKRKRRPVARAPCPGFVGSGLSADVEADFVGRCRQAGHRADADAVGRQAHGRQRAHDVLGIAPGASGVARLLRGGAGAGGNG